MRTFSSIVNKGTFSRAKHVLLHLTETSLNYHLHSQNDYINFSPTLAVHFHLQQGLHYLSYARVIL